MAAPFDPESLTLDDIRAVVDLAWKRWGGITGASVDLETAEYDIRRWLREQPRSIPSGHQWLQLLRAAGDEIVERIIHDLGAVGVGIRSLVLLTYPTDEDLHAFTEEKWSANVQAMVMREVADTLRTRKIKVVIALIDYRGYRNWCREHSIEENESILTPTTYALSKTKKHKIRD